MFIRRKFKAGQRVEVRFIEEREKPVETWLQGEFVEYDQHNNRVVKLDDGRRIALYANFKVRPLHPGLLGLIFYWK